MAKGVERRHSARVTIPSRFSGPGLAEQPVRLIDLSSAGARIELRHPLHTGLRCLVDLPPALGWGTFSGRIVWTTLHRNEQSLEGERQHYYRSGLIWTGVPPAQQDALAAALELLRAAQESADTAPPA